MNERDTSMRILAGAFPDVDGAREAEAALRQGFDLEDADVDVAALAAIEGSSAVLAARIRANRIDQARDVMERHGGEVVTDIPERWTRL